MSAAAAIKGRLTYEMEKFLKKFTKEMYNAQNACVRDEFRREITKLYKAIPHLNIRYSCLISNPMCKIIICMCKLMTIFCNDSVYDLLTNVDYVLCLKFCQFVIKYKTIFISEKIIEDIEEVRVSPFVFDHKVEELLCRTYIFKFNKFQFKCNESELKEVKQHFTRFLLEYINMIIRLKIINRLDTNVNLLLEIADLDVLVKNTRFILHPIRITKKFIIWKSITEFCIDKNHNLEISKFLNSADINLKLETCIMTYYALQYICQHLYYQCCQTSQILSIFTIEKVIHFIEVADDKSNKEFDKIYKQIVKFINFKTCEKIQTISSPVILKCVQFLELLLNNLNCGLHNCPFPIVIFSLLYELVMITDVDKEIILPLISLAIDYLKICKLPLNFMAVSYAFKIYQKLKSDKDLKMKLKPLCYSLVISFNTRREINQNLIDDLENLINIEEDWLDKCVIISYFLSCCVETYNMEDENLNKIFFTLNEQVIYLFHEDNSLGSQLIFPYSVSLKFSMLNINEDYLIHNVAVFKDFLTIIVDDNEKLPLDDTKYFLLTALQYYRDLKCLSKNFSMLCCNYILKPLTMNIDIFKSFFKVLTPIDFQMFMNLLEIQTVTVVQDCKESQNAEFNSYLHQIWSDLSKMQMAGPYKKLRKIAVNHFCLFVEKTFLFRPKIIPTDEGLKLLIKVMCVLLRVPWVDLTLLINSSLRILTYVEKSSVISDIQVYTEAIELLIVLYKCPNNAIVPYLGLFVASFTQLFGKYWIFIKSNIDDGQKRYENDELMLPLHKFEKCASLFQQNKSQFNFICRYFLENLVEQFVCNGRLPISFMKMCHRIVFNIMSICSREEKTQLMLNIKGPALSMFNKLYEQYQYSFGTI